MTLVVLSSLAAGAGSFREVGIAGVLITGILALGRRLGIGSRI